MKKRITALLLAVMMVLSLAACAKTADPAPTPDAEKPVEATTTAPEKAPDTTPAEDASAEDPSAEAVPAELSYDFKAGYTVLGNATNFFVNVNNGIEATCKEKGIELGWTINDRDASKMKTAIDTYVMQGADIIIDFTVLAETGSAIAAELREKGIPMISVDCVYDNAYFFGVNNAGCGEACGEYAEEWIDANWESKLDAVQVLYNESSGETVLQRVKCGADLLITDGYITDEKVTYTNINSSGATTTDVSYVRSLVVDYLTAHPNDKHILILAQTDEQATAANAAVMSSNRVDDVIIVSNNCDDAVVAMLQKQEGAIIGTLNYNSAGYGEQIIDACARILQAEKNGEELDQHFYNKVYMVNRDNVWEYYPEQIVE